MSRTTLAGLLIFLLIFMGLLSRRGEIIALALPLLVYLLAGLVRAPEDLNLRVDRYIEMERIAPGQNVEINISVTNLGASQENLLIEDRLPNGIEVVENSNRRLVNLKKGESLVWTYTIQGKRGYYPFPGVVASARDMLGIQSNEKTFPTGGHLFIMPGGARLRNVAIRPRNTRVYAGTIPARTGGSGIEFFGVREYQPGDSQHWINWHASARYEQSLFTNEFEQERVADVGIILDGRRGVNEFSHGQSIFEHSILAATSLSEAFLASGNRVGLLIYGKYINWTYPGYGKIQREKIMQALARAELGDSEVFSSLTIPRRLFPSYSQMVIVSPLQSDDIENLIQLRSAGFQVIVVSPDPVPFELTLLPQGKSTNLAARIIRIERELMLQRLKRAGIQVVNWDSTSQSFENVVQAALSRPPAWLRAINMVNAP